MSTPLRWNDRRLASLRKALDRYAVSEENIALRAMFQQQLIVSRTGKEALPVRLLLDDTTAPAAGNSLVEFDREFRRAAQYLRPPAASTAFQRKSLRPSGPAAVEVDQATPGSLDFLLLVVDRVRDLLLSDPIQMLLTVAFFLEHRPANWGSRRPGDTRSANDIATEVLEAAQHAQQMGQPTRVRFEKRFFGRYEFTLEPVGTEQDDPEERPPSPETA